MNGRYLYFLDQQLQEIEEGFELDGSPGGHARIRSWRYAGAGGPRVEVDAELDSFQIRQAQFRWTGPDQSLQRRYLLGKDGWQIDGEVFDAGKECQLFGLMRVFTGPLLRVLLESGGEGCVLSPGLEPGPGLLAPRKSVRSVEEQPPCPVPGSAKQAKRWVFLGGPYNTDCLCWTGPDGLLLAYEWLQQGVGKWSVRLDTEFHLP